VDSYGCNLFEDCANSEGKTFEGTKWWGEIPLVQSAETQMTDGMSTATAEMFEAQVDQAIHGDGIPINLLDRVQKTFDQAPKIHGEENGTVEIQWLGYTGWANGYFDLPGIMRLMLLLHLFVKPTLASPESEMVVAHAQANLLKAQADVTYGYFLMCFCALILLYICWLTFSKWLEREVRHLKWGLLVYGIANISIPLVFKWFMKKTDTYLFPQGARQNMNRAGMFLTGLLSLALFVLAPIMGAKKIVEMIKPVLEMLRQMPYASWIMSWIKKWWEGEVDFDDLPATPEEFRKHMDQADADDLLSEIKKTRQRMYEDSLNEETSESGPDIRKATDAMKSQYARQDSPVRKMKEDFGLTPEQEARFQESHEKLNDMLEQVEEDKEETRRGIHARDETVPTQENIPFNYDPFNLIAGTKWDAKQLVPCKICQCRICNSEDNPKMLTHCGKKCKHNLCSVEAMKTSAETTSSSTTEKIEPQGWFSVCEVCQQRNCICLWTKEQRKGQSFMAKYVYSFWKPRNTDEDLKRFETHDRESDKMSENAHNDDL